MRILAAALFYPMLWLRPLVMFAAKLLGGLYLLGALLFVGLSLLYPDEAHPGPGWGFALAAGALAFALFLLREFYDRILLRLNPTGQTLILFK